MWSVLCLVIEGRKLNLRQDLISCQIFSWHHSPGKPFYSDYTEGKTKNKTHSSDEKPRGVCPYHRLSIWHLVRKVCGTHSSVATRESRLFTSRQLCVGLVDEVSSLIPYITDYAEVTRCKKKQDCLNTILCPPLYKRKEKKTEKKKEKEIRL